MPKMRKNQLLAVTVPALVADRLKEQARAEGRSVSNLLRRLITQEQQRLQVQLELDL